MRTVSVSTMVVMSLWAALPDEAGAQDRRTHWGVSAGLAPRWTASAAWAERLYGADTMDWGGADLRVGVVRGSDLGGDWGIAFVRRSIEDGEFTSSAGRPGAAQTGAMNASPVATSRAG